MDEIYDTLRKSEDLAKKNWYVAETRSRACGITNKLALVFELLAPPAGALIRVKKNLRTCGDCHTVMKFAPEIFDMLLWKIPTGFTSSPMDGVQGAVSRSYSSYSLSVRTFRARGLLNWELKNQDLFCSTHWDHRMNRNHLEEIHLKRNYIKSNIQIVDEGFKKT
ncbi:hypothetical protein NC651_012182 [Populus alba x Populus x berolinensis]|nr:hypothetical protein NC651_012182 [Populus alba x Populus x berolinensis]